MTDPAPLKPCALLNCPFCGSEALFDNPPMKGRKQLAGCSNLDCAEGRETK